MMKFDSAIVYSKNVGQSAAFYRNQLGLKTDYEQDDSYVSLWFSNGVRLGIRKAGKDREVPGAQTFFMATDSAHKEYKRLQAADVPILDELAEYDWGLFFSVKDPDGNKVSFIQRAR